MHIDELTNEVAVYHESSEMVFNQEPINQQILILFYVESYYALIHV